MNQRDEYPGADNADGGFYGDLAAFGEPGGGTWSITNHFADESSETVASGTWTVMLER